MSKVLITGASGRLAEHVVNALRKDHELRLFSRTKPPADRDGIPWIQGDLQDYEACQRAVEGMEVIQHVGGVPWPTDLKSRREQRAAEGRPVPPFDETMMTNVMGTYYLMTAAVEAGVKTVIQTGSNCAFGF